jgi:hypothetical protein
MLSVEPMHNGFIDSSLLKVEQQPVFDTWVLSKYSLLRLRPFVLPSFLRSSLRYTTPVWDSIDIFWVELGNRLHAATRSLASVLHLSGFQGARRDAFLVQASWPCAFQGWGRRSLLIRSSVTHADERGNHD